MPNIYTRTGDDGTTGLIGGQRVSKDHVRIDAYGTVDELNSALGLAAAARADRTAEIESLLYVIQNELFTVGANLATPPDSPYAAGLPQVSGEWSARLEREIDDAQGRLPELRQFILPGGTELASRLHYARTVSRRAERLVVSLHRLEPMDESVMTYLNRLSDWLFVYARLANQLDGNPDVAWRKP
jgi:cob(I)alamin adenosyltransferase